MISWRNRPASATMGEETTGREGVMKLSRTLGMVGLLLLLGAGTARPQPGAIDLKPVKYAGLQEAVKAHRGKVVLVDFWRFD